MYVAGLERGVRPIGLWSISMILSMCSAPFERVVGPDRFARAVQLARQGPVQDVRDERALAAARHAGHRHERPERDLEVDVPEVVLAGAADDELLARLPLRRRPGIGTGSLAAEVGAR